MAAAKPHLEFTPIDMTNGWETPPGYKHGFWQKILSSDLDELNKTGSRSRLLRVEPGVYSEVPFLHDHWEEVFLAEGDLIVGNDANGVGGEQFVAPTYACRPPGVPHGPFKSENGCVMFELHYYPPKSR
jgi:hypothetical protein